MEGGGIWRIAIFFGNLSLKLKYCELLVSKVDQNITTIFSPLTSFSGEVDTGRGNCPTKKIEIFWIRPKTTAHPRMTLKKPLPLHS
jgi:hypothetical protein